MKRTDGEIRPAIESRYLAARGASAAALAQSLESLLPSTRSHPISRQRFTVLDTFDGRIRRAGGQLTRAGRKSSAFVTWQSRDGGSRFTVPLTQPANFAWEFPEGPLQRVLAPAIGVRRLLDQVDAETSGALLDVLDDQGKTVARVRIETGQARMPGGGSEWLPLPTMVTLTGLRGYESAYRRLVPVVESRPGIEPCTDGLHAVILQQIGASDRPGSSAALALRPDVEADAGTRQVLLAQLAVLTANEPGVRANLDSEFLHDFRVAVRRTRSLIGQIRLVLPSIVASHFAGEFSWLGRLTGRPRDLDVLILTLRTLQSDFEPTDFAEVMAFLDQEQTREYRQLVEVLDSGRYQTLCSEWRAFLSEPASPVPDAANAKRPFVDVISRRAWRLTRRIGESTAALDQRTSPEDLHKVRIVAKKLRYLVDAAPAFFDAEDLAAVLESLKKMQRVLGHFNDAEVQEKRLLEYGRSLGVAGGAPGALLVFGRLAERSRQRRDDMRQSVIEELRQFAARGTRSACRRAFKRASGTEVTS